MQLNYNQQELPEIAKRVLTLSKSKTILFEGSMGVGKTTLIKEMCKELGVEEQAASPTFSIVNEYEGRLGSIYHFDFYRINDPNEALDFGVEDYLYGDNWVFMEWPEKIQKFLPADSQKIMIQKNEDGTRSLQLIE